MTGTIGGACSRTGKRGGLLNTVVPTATVCVLLWGLSCAGSSACTGFQLNRAGQIYVGKNYDWMVPDGLIMVNKRGLRKTAAASVGAGVGFGTPARWVARYGSITLNQYGREQPAGGMNEAGLVVESMGLFAKSRYPTPDDRPSIGMQQWMQYQLDTASGVRDVLASDAVIRIRPKEGVNIHYLVSDGQGNCAVIDFLGGDMVVHTGPTLPVRVLTNDVYSESLAFFQRGAIPWPDRYRSIERFTRAAELLKRCSHDTSSPPVDAVFGILERVMWSAHRERNGVQWTTRTQWSIVYDTSHRRIYFQTAGNRDTRYVDFAAFDFACTTPVQILDINAPLAGDVSGAFADCTRQANRDLIGKAYDKTAYLPELPAAQLDALAAYPDTIVCGE